MTPLRLKQIVALVLFAAGTVLAALKLGPPALACIAAGLFVEAL